MKTGNKTAFENENRFRNELKNEIRNELRNEFKNELENELQLIHEQLKKHHEVILMINSLFQYWKTGNQECLYYGDD